MNFRALGATIAQYSYNHVVTRVPSRRVRQIVLRGYLARLGKGCSIQLGVRFLNGPRVSLGNRVIINPDCLIDGRRYHVAIGDDVSIGPAATILTLGHDPQSPDFADAGGPVEIGPRVWIAYGALILPGVSIGEGAVVAAGSVVTRDVGSHEIVAGVPARPIGTRYRDLRYHLAYDPWLR